MHICVALFVRDFLSADATHARTCLWLRRRVASLGEWFNSPSRDVRDEMSHIVQDPDDNDVDCWRWEELQEPCAALGPALSFHNSPSFCPSRQLERPLATTLQIENRDHVRQINVNADPALEFFDLMA